MDPIKEEKDASVAGAAGELQKTYVGGAGWVGWGC